MTGIDLINSAIALMGETDPTDYTAYATPLINLVLAETFDLNNNLRAAKSEEVLTAIPAITAVTDNIAYENELLPRVLPLGLVCRLYVDEGNTSILSMYKQEYDIAKRETDRKIAVSEWF